MKGAARRILCAIGPGDAVNSFRHWRSGEQVISETSQTYSSQFFEYCRRNGHFGRAVSSHERADRESGERMVVENRPKRLAGGGVRYHVSQALHGLSLMASAMRWRADTVIVDSGSTHWILLALLKPFGIRVVGNLHNTLWPSGYPPTGLVHRIVLRTEGWFWRYVADGLLAVSPECERQVRQLVPAFRAPSEQYRAQYRPGDLTDLPVAPSPAAGPFRVLFAGRVERNKGVLDLIDMAQSLERNGPGRVIFEVCGHGPAQEELERRVASAGLQHVIRLRGRLDRPALLAAYSASHLIIVPTRSDFVEGFAMVAAEAMLCGRPVLASPVVPAAEVLAEATVLAHPDDPASYAAAIERLLVEPAEYARLVAACERLKAPFLDPEYGLARALERLERAMALQESGVTPSRDKA
jgi:glycosyltransferase involved in cell wall biosynthesis